MNHLSLQFGRFAPRSLCALLVGAHFCLPSGGYAAAMDCALRFGDPSRYDFGKQTSLAAHPSGLIVELHQTDTPFDHSIWYRIGALDRESVTWGGSQRLNVKGHWPAIAISKEGYVVFVYSTGMTKAGSALNYRVGKIDPNGGGNQSITWLMDSIFWDAGYHSSIAINDNGVIVGVHESGTGGNGLYYRIGHFSNPAVGNYTIKWDSGQWGIKYDEGINPHIAINKLNEIVEVHQVPGESYLHYRRGTLSGGAIHFGESKRYDNYAERPAVALLDSGLVLEVHGLGGLISRTGKLSRSNLEEIEWADPVKLVADTNVAYPSLAVNGTYAVETHESHISASARLLYSVAKICE